MGQSSILNMLSIFKILNIMKPERAVYFETIFYVCFGVVRLCFYKSAVKSSCAMLTLGVYSCRI